MSLERAITARIPDEDRWRREADHRGPGGPRPVSASELGRIADDDALARLVRRCLTAPERLVEAEPVSFAGSLEITLPVAHELFQDRLDRFRPIAALASAREAEGDSWVDLHAAQALVRVNDRTIVVQTHIGSARAARHRHELIETAHGALMSALGLGFDRARDAPLIDAVIDAPLCAARPELEEGAIVVDHLEEWLGIAPCRHREAAFEPNETRDALVLACPECWRRRLALVPAHRLPAGHPMWAQIAGGGPPAARAYMDRERAVREALGEPMPDVADLAGLRALEGIVSLNPADHLPRAPSIALVAGAREALRRRRIS